MRPPHQSKDRAKRHDWMVQTDFTTNAIQPILQLMPWRSMQALSSHRGSIMVLDSESSPQGSLTACYIVTCEACTHPSCPRAERREQANVCPIIRWRNHGVQLSQPCNEEDTHAKRSLLSTQQAQSQEFQRPNGKCQRKLLIRKYPHVCLLRQMS